MGLKSRAAVLTSRSFERAKRMTLIEVLLSLILLLALGIYDRLGDANDHLETVSSSSEELRNSVNSESADIQTKLDEQKSALDDIAANQ